MAIFFRKFPKSHLLHSPDTPQNWQKIKIKIKKPKKKRTHRELGT
jgi:hypothetical protein